MASKSNSGLLFAGFAAGAFAGWTALVVSFAAFDPFGLVRAAPDGRDSAGEPIAAVTAVLTPRPGPAGPLARPAVRFGDLRGTDPRGAGPTFTHIRYNPRSGRAIFAGRGRPGARIAVLEGARAAVYMTVGDDGRWMAAAAFDARQHGAAPLAFTIEQRDPLTGDLIVGGHISLHLPDRFRQSVNVAAGEPAAAAAAFRLIAVKAESDSLGPAASEAFDRFFERDAGTGREATAPRLVYAQNGAWGWLDNANRSYQDEIVERLRRGGGGFAGAETELERRDTDRRETGARDWDTDAGGAGRRFANAPDRAEPTGLTGSLTNWLDTARRSYETEIIPRLSGEVPRVIRLREEEVEAERLAEEERRRRREAEEGRRAAEEDARRIAADRARIEREAAERRRLERERAAAERAERQRVAALEAERRAAEQAERERLAALEADRQAQEEARRRAEEVRRRAEEDRARRERAEREARERAERAADERAEREARERAERDARERAERERLASLRRAEEERRAAEAERRRRMIAEAAAIRERREAEQRRRLEELRARREEARQRLARRTTDEDRPGERAGDTRFIFDRRRDPDREPPLPDKYVARDGFTRREIAAERTAFDAARRNERVRLPEINRRERDRETTVLAQRAEPTRAAAKRRARVSKQRTRLAPRRLKRCQGLAGRRIDPPGTYVVKPGDSLWRIARRHYNRGSVYPVIHRANRRKIRVARLIYPCQRFHLPALKAR